MDWFEPWEKVFDDSNPPFYKCFVGAKTNIVYNALDRHVKAWRRNKLALIWEGEPGDCRTFSYYRLWQEVNRFANILKGMGVKKGDRVTIYMGRIPELPIAMLACAKIGAIHSVVYGGFSVEALAECIQDAQSKVLITADGGWMRGKIVRLKDIADEAVKRSPVVEHMIVVKRTGHEVHTEEARPPRTGANCGSGQDRGGGQTPQDPQRQDHAPRAAGQGPGAARGRPFDAGRLDAVHVGLAYVPGMSLPGTYF